VEVKRALSDEVEFTRPKKERRKALGEMGRGRVALDLVES